MTSSKIKKILLFSLSIPIVLATISLLAYNYATNLVPVPDNIYPQIITIKPGESKTAILSKLKDKKMISSYLLARVYFRIKNINPKPGLYSFDSPASLKTISTIIEKGPKDIWITFPEGWRREQYAKKLTEVIPDFDYENFLEISSTLEGQLYPDTYLIPPNASAVKIINLLTTNFKKKSGLQESRYSISIDNKKINLTANQVLSAAALLERETRDDKQIIAGIILKRLVNNWPLQLDASIQYAKDTDECSQKSNVLSCIWWGSISSTKFDSTFNTYQNLGLTPAPIANPSASSITAILNPTESLYWYYIAGNDGINRFAKDLNEHNLNIDRYLRQ